ncbi:hypothetical protein IV88_GL001252 [Pediococcus argentinicus]|uniref:Uncharacterized protein n=2 Tax=Pediococcus argentinicus TaxID=480391 RepID=A0A0R2NNJ8_9LACO|nr:hypothetical protein IV88_GL001252 [Pediococcus argentinicus]NKZ21766.1 hypothetical protein [Pediococcus argentinicus]
MVTIPKEFSNNCEEYALYKGEDGEIILIPRRPSVFDDPKLKDVDFVQHAEIKGIVGEEDI